MKAVRFHQYGEAGELRYETVPDPEPLGDEVLIRVRACGVNHIDVMLRSGELRLPGQQPLPHILGMEVAGEVIAAGPEVRQFRSGDRVLAAVVTCGRCRFCRAGWEQLCDDRRMLGTQLPGGYAEQVKISERGVLPIPPGLSFEAAAASRTSFATAWHLLITRGRLQAGEVVLINSASSGVGSAGVQIAKLAGATVIATTSTAEKAERLSQLGADIVVNYRLQDVAEIVRRATEGRGIDFVFDMVGGETLTRSLELLTKRGRLALCGAVSERRATVDLISLFFREIEIIGSTGSTLQEVERVLQLVNQGKLRPIIDRLLPLSQAAEAHRLMEQGKLFGKLVLVPDALLEQSPTSTGASSMRR
ncbi:MAG: alcohol dehydrogenase [Acidobacteria bacterium]|nr:MAG: alcohol dehydrogenase [Acidobacteriota bacterium]